MARPSKAEKLPFCRGCRDDFYNGKNSLGVRECWNLKGAKKVVRYRIGTWTTPDTPGAFTKVRTLDCHRPNGAVHYDRLPHFATETRDET